MSEVDRNTIRLQYPISLGTSTCDVLKLREPKYRDYMELGDPWYCQFTPDGRPFPVDHEPTIAAYIEKCLIEPKNYLLVSQQATIADARRLKQWLGQFFGAGAVDPQEKSEGSTTPSLTSSTITAA